MTYWITALLVIVSTFFMLLAAIGLVQMPDVFARLQVTTKGATLGAGLVLLAVGFFFADIAIFARALLGIAFLVLTQPVAAHMIGRAAYIGRADMWERTVVNDLEDSTQLTIGQSAAFVTTGEILEALQQENADETTAGQDPPTILPERRA
jgi:multicomponent Na+:H+ antiporter subunit G